MWSAVQLVAWVCLEDGLLDVGTVLFATLRHLTFLFSALPKDYGFQSTGDVFLDLFLSLALKRNTAYFCFQDLITKLLKMNVMTVPYFPL